MIPTLIKTSIAGNATNKANSLDTNPYPVIGIVSQPLPSSLKSDPRFEGKSTYIMQAYADFMKSAGARVIPIVMTDD